MSSDPTCIFCRIVAGELPSRKVYSDDHAYAFLDITPWHRGHTLIIPRRHVPDLVHGAPAMSELAPAVDAVSRLLVERLAPDGLNLFSAAGEVAGQEVLHLHLHVVPRYASAPGSRALFNPRSVTDAELDEVHDRLLGSPSP
jgi:histidine triad (HIT) family protein